MKIELKDSCIEIETFEGYIEIRDGGPIPHPTVIINKRDIKALIKALQELKVR